MMTEEELREFLDANKATIQAAVRDRLINQMIESHRWQISEQIATVVDAFVKDEIVPEVKKYLTDNKGPLVEAALKGATEIGNTLATRLVERTAKSLAPDSYQFRNVMKALFE